MACAVQHRKSDTHDKHDVLVGSPPDISTKVTRQAKYTVTGKSVVGVSVRGPAAVDTTVSTILLPKRFLDGEDGSCVSDFPRFNQLAAWFGSQRALPVAPCVGTSAPSAILFIGGRAFGDCGRY